MKRFPADGRRTVWNYTRGMTLLRCTVAIVVGTVLATLTVNPSQAAPAAVACGDTITRDTTLHADLINCPNNGLVIGADNLTLNLNGHTIDGDALTSACGPDQTCDVGVADEGHDEVTVVGGTVREFRMGIATQGADRNRLRNLSVSHNTDFGITVGTANGSRIERTSMRDNGTSGLVMVDSRRSVVVRDAVSGSGGYGIALFGFNDSTIRENRLDGNDHGILADASSRNAIDHNSVSHSGGSSIDFGNGATGNRIERNRLTDNGDGIIATQARGNVISRNVVRGTGFFGFPDTGGFGLILDGSSRNIVDRNRITGGRGPAIFVTSLDAPTASAGNVVSRNVVRSVLDDGILVNNGATGTLIRRNIAIGNGDDGIHVDTATTTLSGNTANRNHDLGIEAVPGVVDGGGNHAAGNSNPLQCTNIVC